MRIQEEHVTLATITLQNYFRLYEKLAGMTGTAKTEEKEFVEIYGLARRRDPDEPRRSPALDENDFIFKTKEAKFDAVVADIKERHETGSRSSSARSRSRRRSTSRSCSRAPGSRTRC